MKLAQGLLFCGLFVLSCARSFGLRESNDGYGCNLMTAQYGCKSGWGYDLVIRIYCLDKTPPGQPQTIMWWASAPAVTRDFTLRTGEGAVGTDPTHYIPGERMPIYITSVKSGHYYQGLLMYAVDRNENKVGDWEAPVDSNPDYQSHPGTTCSQSVMHASATYKRRVAQFSFITPPKGTGPITFRVMWKDGQPNPTSHGGFWIPPANLTLSEASVSVPVWGVINSSITCAQYCSNRGGMVCVTKALGQPWSAADRKQILRSYGCQRALFSECSVSGPRVINSNERLCSFLDVQNCSGTRATAQPTCTTVSSPDTPLLCKCYPPGTDPTSDPAPLMDDPVINPAGQVKPHFAWMFVIGLTSMWSMRNSYVFSALCLFGLFSSAQAHNWIEGARGRAKNMQASTVQPALPPVHPLKIDMQIYMGQEVLIEWATAHGGTNYFVVMSQSDEMYLNLNTVEALEDYIARAPAGSDHDGTANSTSSRHQKFGRNRASAAASVGSLYSATIASTDMMYLGNRSSVWPFQIGATFQYSYASTRIVKDRRLAYTNPDYPWIEAVHKYTNEGSDIDSIRLTIPARKGPGRYIIQYLWLSYRDIYDIDIHAAPTPGAQVANPYGVLANGDITYMQFDHCIFEGVQYLGQCFEAPTDGVHARNKCNIQGQSCVAYALVPIRTLPPWDDYTQLPFKTDKGLVNPGCNKSDLILRTPEDGLASYTIQYYRSFDNGAAPPWTIITDPENLGWYSTCYVKLSPLQFDLPITSLPVALPSELPYRFGNKCIPCEDRGMNLTNGPRWRTAAACINCDKEPAPKLRNTDLNPVVATRTLNTSFASDWNCHRNPTQPPCANITWITLGGSAFMWEEDCLAKVATTPNCSKYGAWLDGGYDLRFVADWYYSEYQAQKNCMCWKATAAATPALRPDTSGWRTFMLA